MVKLAIHVAFCGIPGAVVATAHRHDQIRLERVRVRERLWELLAWIESTLLKNGDNLGVEVVTRI